jgi:hypothetical protein
MSIINVQQMQRPPGLISGTKTVPRKAIAVQITKNQMFENKIHPFDGFIPE